jgi:uncharacterized membrane protein YfcA
MISFFSGFSIGLVMGITGGSGALIAIPLFMHFLHMTLKDATVNSLLAVILGSFFNFILLRKNAHYKLATVIAAFSFLGSVVSSPLKIILPVTAIKIILSAVSAFALFQVFKASPVSRATKPRENIPMILNLGVGLLLGCLTTLTGLGGGILMVPILLKYYAFDGASAVSTSLLVVSVSSLISLMVQMQKGFMFSLNANTFYLLIGILGSAILVKLLTKNISPQVMLLVRKVVFSLVVVLALVKLLT